MDHKEFQKYNSLVKKSINVFEPNLTSNLSLLAAEKNIRKIVNF